MQAELYSILNNEVRTDAETTFNWPCTKQASDRLEPGSGFDRADKSTRSRRGSYDSEPVHCGFAGHVWLESTLDVSPVRSKPTEKASSAVSRFSITNVLLIIVGRRTDQTSLGFSLGLNLRALKSRVNSKEKPSANPLWTNPNPRKPSLHEYQRLAVCFDISALNIPARPCNIRNDPQLLQFQTKCAVSWMQSVNLAKFIATL
ncbi:uncharacterized protein RCO7_14583 [Rhynchosporium graminicola]|uniref:Uncharacterized protein n=1 Tax=Rhynchosporium graminicola TaxID=2792576 RepID=A0A1E1KQ87_9HELO|nr:uncharacterized protein RCO7_14583 [Rhynchosporium commune]